MAKHKKNKLIDEETRQAKQYDKIFKENIRRALPGILKNVLGIQAAATQHLPATLQHTKEREADVLAKITDKTGGVFILHLDFQSTNDHEIAYRMGEYRVMTERKYRVATRQYVVYIGPQKMTLPDRLEGEGLLVKYNLIDISKISYTEFLHAGCTLKEMVFAILADFGDEDAETVVAKITDGISQSTAGDLEKLKAANQLRVLANLRNLAHINFEEAMESVSTFFKKENDFLYVMGIKKGEQGKKEAEAREKEAEAREKEAEERDKETKKRFVKYLLANTGYGEAEIAAEAGVSIDFVKKIKEAQ